MATYHIPNRELLFNVQDYGAIGDGVTDDGPAIQAAGNAAIDSASSLAGRFGTIFFPPLPKGGSYRIATPVAWSVTQGVGIAGALRFKILGSGMDGPLQIAVGDNQTGLSATASLMEWAEIEVDSISTIAANGTYDSSGAVVGAINAQYALQFGSGGHLGQVILRNIQTIGTYVSGAVLHINGGNVLLDNYKSDGDVAFGNTYKPIVLIENTMTFSVNKAYKYNEFRLGDRLRDGYGVLLGMVDSANGTGLAFFQVEGISYGSQLSRFVLSSIRQDDNTSVYFLYSAGTNRIGSLTIADSSITVNTYGVYLNNADTLTIRSTQFSPGSARDIVFVDNVGTTRIESVSSGGLGNIDNYDGSGVVYVSDSDLGAAPSNVSPSGIYSATSALLTAFATTNGIKSRLAFSGAAITAHCLVKPDGSGNVIQLADGDDGYKAIGVSLDGASGASKYTLVSELRGQRVSIATDGTSITEGQAIYASALSSHGGQVSAVANGKQIGIAVGNSGGGLVVAELLYTGVDNTLTATYASIVPQWAPATWIANGNPTATFFGGDTITGETGYITQVGKVLGILFYWASATAANVDATLWAADGTTVLKRTTVAVNGIGLYTATFSTPYVVGNGQLMNKYTISTRTNPVGGGFTAVTAANWGSLPAPGQSLFGTAGFYAAPYWWVINAYVKDSAVGDVAPTTIDANNWPAMQLIFSN